MHYIIWTIRYGPYETKYIVIVLHKIEKEVKNDYLSKLTVDITADVNRIIYQGRLHIQLIWVTKSNIPFLKRVQSKIVYFFPRATKWLTTSFSKTFDQITKTFMINNSFSTSYVTEIKKPNSILRNVSLISFEVPNSGQYDLMIDLIQFDWMSPLDQMLSLQGLVN